MHGFKYLIGATLVTFSLASPQAITVTVTQTTTPTECPGPICHTPCNPFSPWPNGSCGDVANRVTCTTFNPDDTVPPPRFGQLFCMCQAGYRGDGLGLDGVDQYRVTWKNSQGDQTHRVFVKPGTPCNQLCNETGANACSEVPIKDSCR